MNEMIIQRLYPLCVCGLLFSGISHAVDTSRIVITGQIRDNTCAVAATSTSVNVDLLMNAAKELSSVGATTPPVPFSIELAPCGPSAKNVKVGFTGSQEARNDALLALDSTSSAIGMGIHLLDSNMAGVAVNADSANLQSISLTAGKSNTLNFYAQLMATGPVSAGTVRATAGFTLEFL